MKYFAYITLLIICYSSYAQTNIGGSFFTDTTLKKSNSPYIVTSNIVVFQGAKLIIEPGVEIKFNSGTHILLRGQLKAVGTPTDSIKFTANNNSPTQPFYTGIKIAENDKKYSYQVQIKHCVFEYASHCFDVDLYSPKGGFYISNSNFRHNGKVFYDNPYYLDSLLIDSCTFYKNSFGIEAIDNYRIRINNSVFEENGIGCNGGVIENSLFKKNLQYGALLAASIKNCIFYNNKVGMLAAQFDNASATDNEMIYNDVGIEISTWRDDTYKNLTMKNNIICKNRVWNIQFNFTTNITLNDNCWCTNDSAKIRATIRDGYVNNKYGLISYDYDDTCSPALPAPIIPPTNIPKHQNQSIKIYPNPFYNSATLLFNYDSNNEYKLIIRDITGRIVRQIQNITNGRVTINKGNLYSGIYILELHSVNNVSVSKIQVR